MMLNDELIKLHAAADEHFEGEDTEGHNRLDDDDEEEEFSASREDEDEGPRHDTAHAEDAQLFSSPSTPAAPYDPPTRESARPNPSPAVNGGALGGLKSAAATRKSPS